MSPLLFSSLGLARLIEGKNIISLHKSKWIGPEQDSEPQILGSLLRLDSPILGKESICFVFYHVPATPRKETVSHTANISSFQPSFYSCIEV